MTSICPGVASIRSSIPGKARYARLHARMPHSAENWTTTMRGASRPSTRQSGILAYGIGVMALPSSLVLTVLHLAVAGTRSRPSQAEYLACFACRMLIFHDGTVYMLYVPLEGLPVQQHLLPMNHGISEKPKHIRGQCQPRRNHH